MKSTSPWLQRWKRIDGAIAHVYGVAHAGAGAAALRGMANGFGPDVDFAAVRLPGRENRFSEPLALDLGEVVEGLCKAVSDEELDAPIVLFGQCSGAAIAFRAAAALAGRLDKPVALAVASYSAPASCVISREFGGLVRVEDLVMAEGFDPLILASPSLMSLLEPMIMADYHLSTQFRWRPDELEIPLLALRGLSDGILSPADLQGWGGATSGVFEFVQVDAGHFAACRAPAVVCAALESFLRRHLL